LPPRALPKGERTLAPLPPPASLHACQERPGTVVRQDCRGPPPSCGRKPTTVPGRSQATFALFAGVSRLVCVPPPPPFPCSRLLRTLKWTFKFAKRRARKKTTTDGDGRTEQRTWQFKSHSTNGNSKATRSWNSKAKKTTLPAIQGQGLQLPPILQRKGPGWVDQPVPKRP
jgi:hypothetical protein